MNNGARYIASKGVEKFFSIKRTSGNTLEVVVGMFFDFADTNVQMTVNDLEYLKLENDIFYLRFNREVHANIYNQPIEFLVDENWKGIKSLTRNYGDHSVTEINLQGITSLPAGTFFGAGSYIPPIKKLIFPNVIENNGSIINYKSNDIKIPLELADFRSFPGTSSTSFWDSYGNGTEEWCTDFEALTVRAKLSLKEANINDLQPWLKNCAMYGSTIEWYNANGELDSITNY